MGVPLKILSFIQFNLSSPGDYSFAASIKRQIFIKIRRYPFKGSINEKEIVQPINLVSFHHKKFQEYSDAK